MNASTRLTVLSAVGIASIAGAALFASVRAASGKAETIGVGAQPMTQDEDGFTLQRRRGSVDLDTAYDMTDLRIPEGEIHTLLPKDAIPALTDPKRQPASEAEWLDDESRVVVAEIGGEVLGVPLAVLNWHEVVNTTLGGEPIAVTYCPLCDSATAFSREVSAPGSDEVEVLEFGVSGALYNSNVLMYDRTHKSLWSQLGMEAVSGPMSGAKLEMLPMRVMSLGVFKEEHPRAEMVSNDTGHRRNYSVSPYERYFSSDSLMVDVKGHGDALAKKTLGLGVSVGDAAWFVPENEIGTGMTLQTPAGEVVIEPTIGGFEVTSAPEGTRTAQTFYYSWSAFYPQTEVVDGGDDGQNAGG